MAEGRMRVLHLLAEGRVKAEEAAQMLDALDPAEGAPTSGPTGATSPEGADKSHQRIVELLWEGRIDAAQATALLNALNALNAPPARVNSLILQGPSDPARRHLRLKWHDASGKRIDQVEVAALLSDANSLNEMLPEKAIELLDGQGVDLDRLAVQAQKLPSGTVVYHYDNDNAQGIVVTVEG